MNQLQFHNVEDVLANDGPDGLEDSSVIQLINFLASRSLHVAIENDIVTLGDIVPQDYVEYIKGVTGQKRVHVARMDTDQQGLVNPQMAISALQQNGHWADHRVNPYILSKRIAHVSALTNTPLAFGSLSAAESGVTAESNDKAIMMRTARQINERAGEEVIPLIKGQGVFNIKDGENLIVTSVYSHIESLIKSHKTGGVFIQVNRSGGGVGNVDVTFDSISNSFVSSKLNNGKSIGSWKDFQLHLNQWMRERVYEGSDHVIVSPLMDLSRLNSHTVTMFINEDGSIINYGVIEQRLNPLTADYEGFNRPALDLNAQRYGAKMMKAAEAYAKEQFSKGYWGPIDVDFGEGFIKWDGREEEILMASESNTRWDGFRFALQYVAMIAGWDLRTLDGIQDDVRYHITAHDHVVSSIGTTTEVIDALNAAGISLFNRTKGAKDGVIIMLPPRSKGNGKYQLGISIIGEDPLEIQRLEQKVRLILNPES